jgi:hypothetical protein
LLGPRKPPLLEALLLAAVLLVAFEIAWTFVSHWYDRTLVIAAGPFTPGWIHLESEDTTILFSRSGSDRAFYFVPTLVLHLPLILSAAVVLATPAMRFLSRLRGALGILLLIVLSHVALLGYAAHVVSPDGGGNLPELFALYWSILPGAIAAVWCYLFWLPRWRERSTPADG